MSNWFISNRKVFRCSPRKTSLSRLPPDSTSPTHPVKSALQCSVSCCNKNSQPTSSARQNQCHQTRSPPRVVEPSAGCWRDRGLSGRWSFKEVLLPSFTSGGFLSPCSGPRYTESKPNQTRQFFIFHTKSPLFRFWEGGFGESYQSYRQRVKPIERLQPPAGIWTTRLKWMICTSLFFGVDYFLFFVRHQIHGGKWTGSQSRYVSGARTKRVRAFVPLGHSKRNGSWLNLNTFEESLSRATKCDTRTIEAYVECWSAERILWRVESDSSRSAFFFTFNTKSIESTCKLWTWAFAFLKTCSNILQILER